MKPGTSKHSKIEDFAERLGIPRAHAFGLIVSLWDHLTVTGERDDGILRGWDHRKIATVSGWRGDATAFVTAALEARLLDAATDGSVVVHDWPEECQRLVLQRWARRWKLAGEGSITKAQAQLRALHDAAIRGQIATADACRTAADDHSTAAGSALPTETAADVRRTAADDHSTAASVRYGTVRLGSEIRSESGSLHVARAHEPPPPDEDLGPGVEDPGEGLRDEAPNPGPVGDPMAETLRQLRAVRQELTGGVLTRRDDDALRPCLADLRSRGALHRAAPAYRRFHADPHWRAAGWPTRAFAQGFASYDAQAQAEARQEATPSPEPLDPKRTGSCCRGHWRELHDADGKCLVRGCKSCAGWREQ